MKIALPSAEKLMSLLSGSPEVKVLLEREKLQAADAEKQARIDCLASLKKQRVTEAQAVQKINDAEDAVKAEKTKVDALQLSVTAAHLAHAAAYRARQTTESLLFTVHNEGLVSKTLYLLDLLIKRMESEIKLLELAKNPHVMVDGHITFRPVSPSVVVNQDILKKRLTAVKKLYEKAMEFVEAEMAPSELKEFCESILAAVGQKLPATEATV